VVDTDQKVKLSERVFACSRMSKLDECIFASCWQKVNKAAFQTMTTMNSWMNSTKNRTDGQEQRKLYLGQLDMSRNL
jgi:IS4 transposase